MDHCVAYVFNLQREGLPYPKPRAGEQGIQNLVLSVGVRDYRFDLRSREAGSVLFLHNRKIHEVVIPLHRVDRLSFVVQDRSNH
jgi:hypothetical protein